MVDALAEAIAKARTPELMGHPAKGFSPSLDEPRFDPPPARDLASHLREVAQLLYGSRDLTFARVKKDPNGLRAGSIDGNKTIFMDARLPAYPEFTDEFVIEGFSKEGAYLTIHPPVTGFGEYQYPIATINKVPWSVSLDTLIYSNIISKLAMYKTMASVRFATVIGEGTLTLKVSAVSKNGDPDVVLSELPMVSDALLPVEFNLQFCAKHLQWIVKKQKSFQIKKLLLNQINVIRIDIEGMWGMYHFYFRSQQ